MNHVVVVDYGMGNLDSVRRALEECGATVQVTGDPHALASADRLVLPGVGAFPEAMSNLHARELDDALTEAVMAVGAQLLGICLGMHLLAKEGTEAGGAKGLGWIPAAVERLETTAEEQRVPHVGWNEVDPVADGGLFAGIGPGTDFYFVHSYRMVCEDAASIAATTPYMGGFTSAVSTANVHGVQFHPEKSQRAGFAVLRNFLAL